MNLLRALPLAALILSASARAGSDVSGTQAPEPSTRYGLFDGLDQRSSYGLGVFPEPFLVDDSDLETGEFRMDWFTARVPGREHDDFFTAELERGFGNLTLEVEVHYTATRLLGSNAAGFDNLDLGARYPLFEAVSKNRQIDTTFGVAAEMGIPMDTAISKDTEMVPKLFNDTKIGNFTMQSIFGFSMLQGPDEDGGLNSFEYGFVFGYAIQKPLAGVEQLIPVFELDGADPVTHSGRGHDSLTANAAIRINLSSIGPIQPRLGFGYVFPLTDGARDTLHQGFYTSLVFEF